MPVDLLALGAALLTGLLGGVHCVAMCGGIATGMASGFAGRGVANPLAHAIALNGGRVLGYTLAGAIVGGLGGGLLAVARSDGLATGLRVLMGGVLLLAAARILWPRRVALPGRLGAAFWRALQPLRARIPDGGAARPWLLGLLWGWLPCGLSTTLLAAAWLEASAVHGALLMFAFGAGTLATMLPLTWSGARFTTLLAQRRWRIGAASLVAVAGVATMAAPWLVLTPGVHALLEALGCRSL